MWFSNKLNDLFENNGTSKNSSRNVKLSSSLDYPPKPTKLTPLYSKKRSEITNIDESIFSKNLKNDALPREEKTFARDASRRSTFTEKLKNELSLIDSSLNNEAVLNEEKKMKKKKKKKNSTHNEEDTVVAFNNDSGSNTLNNTETTDDQSTAVPAENEKTNENLDKSDLKTSFFKINNLASSIEEIWNTQHLQPNVDETVNLGTIVEEFPDSKLRTKVLGARKVNNLEDLADQNQSKPIYTTRDNTEISTRFSMKRPKSSGTYFRSPADDDSITLVDDFSRESYSGSSSASTHSSNLINRPTSSTQILKND